MGVQIRERYVNLILHKILTHQDPNFLDFRSPCGAVIGQLAYNYNGDIYCCDEGRNFDMFKLGNVEKHSYKDIVTSTLSQQIIKSSIIENYICDNCVYKPYCGVCPVLNYAEEGNIIPKLGQNSRCKLFKVMFDYVFDKLIFDEQARQIFFDWVNHWRNPKKNIPMELLNNYNISPPTVIKTKTNPSTSNIIKIINAGNEKYVFKKYGHDISEKDLMKNFQVINFLNKNRLKVACPIKTRLNELFFKQDGRYACLFHYHESDINLKAEQIIRIVSKNLAKFHNIMLKYDKRKVPSFYAKYKLAIQKFESVISNNKISKVHKQYLKNQVQDIKKIFMKNVNTYFDNTIIHGDYKKENIIFTKKGIICLDLNPMYGPKMFDISKGILSFILRNKEITNKKKYINMFINTYLKTGCIKNKDIQTILLFIRLDFIDYMSGLLDFTYCNALIKEFKEIESCLI